MAKRALTEVAERPHLRIGVVDALDHGELIRWTTTGLLCIELESLIETRKGVFLDTGHQLVTGLLDSRVQRDGEGELLGKIGEGTDSGNDAAGRNSEVPSADIRPMLGVELTKRLDGGIEVVEWFSLSHEHHARDALVEVVRHMKYLVDHLLGGERARQTGDSGGAEHTAHGASGLRRDADSKLGAAGHRDGFHRDAVRKAEQIFARAVGGDLAGDLLGRVEGELLCELLP